MAFPTYVSHDGGALASDVTTYQAEWPFAGTLDAGDLLIGIHGADGIPDHTFGALLTELFEQADATNAVKLAIVGRVGTGSGATQETVNLSVAEMYVYDMARITGWWGTLATGIEIAVASGASSTPDPPSLTPSWGAADTLWLAGYIMDSNRTNTTVASGYTEIADRRANNTNGVHLSLAYRTANVATENPGTFQASASDQWIAFTIAIRPAAAGVSGTAAISQSSSATATGRRSASVTAAISQAHTATATPRKAALASAAAISQASAIAAAGAEGGLRPAAISQTNAAAATGAKNARGTAAISQASSVTATGEGETTVPGGFGEADIAQASSVTAAGRKAAAGAGAISQASGVTAAGVENALQTAAISQPSATSASGVKGAAGVAAMAQTHSTAAGARTGRFGVAVLPVANSTSATGPVIRSGAAAIAQTHAITAVGVKQAGHISTFELMERISRVLEPPPSLAPANIHLTISGVTRDRSGSEPFIYEPNTLYLWLDEDDESGLSAEVRRHNFVIRSLFIADALDEEPQHRRRRDVSIVLDEKRKEYLARIAEAMTGEDWENIMGSADWDAIRTLEGRGIAVIIRGHRLLSIA